MSFLDHFRSGAVRRRERDNQAHWARLDPQQRGAVLNAVIGERLQDLGAQAQAGARSMARAGSTAGAAWVGSAALLVVAPPAGLLAWASTSAVMGSRMAALKFVEHCRRRRVDALSHLSAMEAAVTVPRSIARVLGANWDDPKKIAVYLAQPGDGAAALQQDPTAARDATLDRAMTPATDRAPTFLDRFAPSFISRRLNAAEKLWNEFAPQQKAAFVREAAEGRIGELERDIRWAKSVRTFAGAMAVTGGLAACALAAAPLTGALALASGLAWSLGGVGAASSLLPLVGENVARSRMDKAQAVIAGSVDMDDLGALRASLGDGRGGLFSLKRMQEWLDADGVQRDVQITSSRMRMV